MSDAQRHPNAGDWLAFPPAPTHAHQMINDSAAPLIYLCVSTTALADVVGYPDSKKIAATAGQWEHPWARVLVHEGEQLDYWEGEPLAQTQ